MIQRLLTTRLITLRNLFPALQSPNNRKTIIANETSTTIVGKGDVHVNKYFTLKCILNVPKLFTNLVSINELQKISIALWYFIPHIVYFMTYTCGKGLDMLGRKMDFIISRNRMGKTRKVYLYHYFLSLPCQIKTRFGFIITILVILCLVFLRSCSLYCSKKQVLTVFIILFVN